MSWWKRAVRPGSTRASSRTSSPNMTPDTFARCAGAGRAGAGAAGRDVLGLRRLARHREDLPVLPGAAGDRRRRLGAARARPGPAAARAAMFLDDIYGEQKHPRRPRHPGRDGPGARRYIPRLRGIKPPGGVRIHIAGIDLIRSPDGVLRVLEDNLRTPSGVSYVVENRLVTKRMFPRAFERRACTASTTTRRGSPRRCARCRRSIPTSRRSSC